MNLTSQGTRETGFPEPFSTFVFLFFIWFLSRVTVGLSITNITKRERNTTLPHEDAQTAPNEELDTSVIADKSHHRRPHIPGHHHNKRQQEQHAERAQAQMYSGLDVEENPDNEKPKDGGVKKVLNKLSCGTV